MQLRASPIPEASMLHQVSKSQFAKELLQEAKEDGISNGAAGFACLMRGSPVVFGHDFVALRQRVRRRADLSAVRLGEVRCKRGRWARADPSTACCPGS